GLPAVTLWAVQVCEVEPPAEGEPLEWLLFTTVAVATVDDAIERVQWYSCRWGIEVWHRILKSGCHLEARQCQKAERLRRALALYSVLAWRIFYATMMARSVPDAPCSMLLEPDEWQALYCAIHQVPTPPAEPPTLGQASPGSPNSAGLWGAVGATAPARKSCGGAFSISATSQRCTALCAVILHK